MAVLMIGEVEGLTEEMYAGMLEGLKPSLQSTEGFMSHAGGPSPNGGWRVVEVWDSEKAADDWFQANVKPNLPPGVVPDRKYFPVHSAFTT
jgi:hypothetical protein